MSEVVRVAIWSGPRNISTALMRSWASRPDAVASDEPLYAHYLSTLTPEARAAHPAADEVMRSQPTDWREVVRALLGPPPPRDSGGTPRVWYQKHMAHHLTPAVDRHWVLGLRTALLVRDPEEMITSFIKVIPSPTPADLGLPQQVELSDFIRAHTGARPPVIDARDVLRDPRAALTKLCSALGVEFHEAMLRWPPGPRTTDGVWGPHWYDRVYASTGFEPWRDKSERVPPRLEPVLAECRRLYDHLLSAP